MHVVDNYYTCFHGCGDLKNDYNLKAGGKYQEKLLECDKLHVKRNCDVCFMVYISITLQLEEMKGESKGIYLDLNRHFPFAIIL